jgi:hypothetical protein
LRLASYVIIEAVSTQHSGRVPKKGDHVGTISHQGLFLVIAAQPENRTATIKLIGADGALVAGVPWTHLTFDVDRGSLSSTPEST